jgi:hypothetical protein
MRRWRGEQFHYCHGGWHAFLSGERLKEKREQENIKSMAFMRSYLCVKLKMKVCKDFCFKIQVRVVEFVTIFCPSEAIVLSWLLK